MTTKSDTVVPATALRTPDLEHELDLLDRSGYEVLHHGTDAAVAVYLRRRAELIVEYELRRQDQRLN